MFLCQKVFKVPCVVQLSSNDSLGPLGGLVADLALICLQSEMSSAVICWDSNIIASDF